MSTVHTVAVVVPVYHGETSLRALVEELGALTSEQSTPAGHLFCVTEIVLVHDCGPGRSDETIRDLARSNKLVRPVWLSRNFGQHAATLAGMASTTSDWVVTMDEDGQHDPAFVPMLIDVALQERVPLVYAAPTNPAPHGLFRNISSRVAHLFSRWLGGPELEHFHSYRLILGELARGLAAYVGEGVYLDVALTWVASRSSRCPVAMRQENDVQSAYSPRKLLSHFWRLVLTSGMRPLRIVSMFGILLALGALVLGGWIVWQRLTSQVSVAGWASVMVVVLVASSALLVSIGVIAEYLGIAVRTSMGKPLYLVVNDPDTGPLGRQQSMSDGSSLDDRDS